MTDNIDNIVLEHLKALRGELKDFRNKHNADMAHIKHRLTALELGMGAVNRDAQDNFMNWASICENPLLANLPYKIQTDKWGNIVMSPASNKHGIYQAKIVALLSRLMQTGTVIAECSVETSEGTKVADVAWASTQFIQTNKDMTPFVEAPEICVEILSPSNTAAEMDEKKELYFARGCKEFWLCDSEGNMKFYKNTGKMEHSFIFNEFPHRVEMH